MTAGQVGLITGASPGLGYEHRDGHHRTQCYVSNGSFFTVQRLLSERTSSAG